MRLKHQTLRSTALAYLLLTLSCQATIDPITQLSVALAHLANHTPASSPIINNISSMATLLNQEATYVADQTSLLKFFNSINDNAGALQAQCANAQPLHNAGDQIATILNNLINATNTAMLTLSPTPLDSTLGILVAIIAHWQAIYTALVNNTMSSSASLWNCAVALHATINTINTYFALATVPGLSDISEQLTALNDFVDTTSTTTAADCKTFNALLSTIVATLLNDIRLYPIANANAITQLLAKDNAVYGLNAPLATLLQIGLDGSLAGTRVLPASYGTINTITLDPTNANIAWCATNSTLFNYIFSTAGSPCVFAAPSIIRNGVKTQTQFTSNPIVLSYSNHKKVVVCMASCGVMTYQQSINPTQLVQQQIPALQNVAITRLFADCNNNIWASCTSNDNTNGLYYMSGSYAGSVYQAPTAAIYIPAPEHSNGQLINYATADANGYPVIVANSYIDNNGVAQSSKIYTLNLDGTVAHVYDCGAASIAPIIAADANNNYWTCLNGDTFACINTTTNTIQYHNFSNALSTLQTNNTPILTCTPSALTADNSNHPWLACTQIPYLINEYRAY